MKKAIKKIVKSILPNFIIKYLKQKRSYYKMRKAFIYDFKRYWKYSSSIEANTAVKLEGVIIKNYHVIEKGLTMPKTRLGFGSDRVISLCKDCEEYVRLYIPLTNQVKHAIGVLNEYIHFHKLHNYKLSENIKFEINKVLLLAKEEAISPSKQLTIHKKDYFSQINSSFPLFSESRKSVRNYTEEDIPLDQLKAALSLTLNTPSACNRQTSRLRIYSDKNKIQRILDIQMGSRGFGHLTNKLIVITAELGVFNEAMERNQAYIDGGIFAMNLLYSLHSQHIACCILNCSNTPKKDYLFQKECRINPNEVFIAMVACGIPPEEIHVAASPRHDLGTICQFIN